MSKTKVFLFLILGGARCIAGGGPLDNATNLGDHYFQSSWFGTYYDAGYPWLYHFEEGWQMVAADQPDSLWLFDPDLGWSWTHEQAYPCLYNLLSGWIYCAGGVDGHRLYYLHAIEDYANDVPVDENYSSEPVPNVIGGLNRRSYRVNDGNPVEVSMEGMDMVMTTTLYEIYMVRQTSGIERSEMILSDLTGGGLIDGEYHTYTGTASSLLVDHLSENAFGRYRHYSTNDMIVTINLEGITFDTVTQHRMTFLERPQYQFLSRDDLYELPVGSVHSEDSLRVRFELVEKFYADGTVQNESESSDLADVSQSWRILAKWPFFVLNGATYFNVVQIRLAATVVHDGNYPSTSYFTYYVAPGVGLIISEQYSSLLGAVIRLDLISREG